MKSLSTIRIDFQKANRQADELDEIAGELRNLSKKELESCMGNLQQAWKGEAASAYISKGKEMQERLILNAKNLEKTAATIRNIAKRTYDAEMIAYQLAQERSYQN